MGGVVAALGSVTTELALVIDSTQLVLPTADRTIAAVHRADAGRTATRSALPHRVVRRHAHPTARPRLDDRARHRDSSPCAPQPEHGPDRIADRSDRLRLACGFSERRVTVNHCDVSVVDGDRQREAGMRSAWTTVVARGSWSTSSATIGQRVSLLHHVADGLAYACATVALAVLLVLGAASLATPSGLVAATLATAPAIFVLAGRGPWRQLVVAAGAIDVAARAIIRRQLPPSTVGGPRRRSGRRLTLDHPVTSVLTIALEAAIVTRCFRSRRSLYRDGLALATSCSSSPPGCG